MGVSSDFRVRICGNESPKAQRSDEVIHGLPKGRNVTGNSTLQLPGGPCSAISGRDSSSAMADSPVSASVVLIRTKPNLFSKN